MFILVKPDGQIVKSVGKGGVQLAQADRGTYSQGFDCVFEAENGLTFAEMPMSQRIIYSHRGRAAKALLDQLKEA
jgi:XTP/dITP diphosphohydrolase